MDKLPILCDAVTRGTFVVPSKRLGQSFSLTAGAFSMPPRPVSPP